MNKHTIFPATAPSRTKRVAIGAASVLTAGALLGVGAQGATAAPLSSVNTTSSSLSAGASGDAGATSNGEFLASLSAELRADLSHGQSGNVKAQKVATTLSEHAELFDTLPANLQDDLTTLTDASGAADRAAAVDTVRTTALAGGYGEEITKIAEAVRDNPEHPLAAAVRAALSADSGTVSGTAESGTADSGTAESGTDQEPATDAAPSVKELALQLADTPALLEKLPADLQADLAELKSTPADEQEAAAQTLEAAALNGDYGTVVQNIAERVQAHVAAETDAGVEVGSGADAGADVSAEADVHAGK
ncbi:hypothetical protein E3T28_05065 [Cryobacterium sinapicolor]|uniref:DUF5667 domain-containing protein n=1 Tax=Cryobacterium sinapicolor TaxID=1259236 RepID=A0ABY2JC59_9MICO|nr:hypothetical protein [Cryobacterium sinapicolor]TFD02549.1 hypothetical protein E3T28_05065 [Cryobacterium sinapicolor]